MSWLYSRALVEDYLEATSLDGDACVRLKITPTQQAYYSKDRTTDSFPRSLSGMTFAPSMGVLGKGLLMWCQEGFPAKTSQQQEKEKGFQEKKAVCGTKWLESLRKFNLSLFGLRTPLSLELGALSLSCKTLPKWGSMQSGELWERTTLMPHINETECGFWPTPTVKGDHNRKGASAKSGDGLATAVKKWPTPQARDWKGSLGKGCQERGGHQSSLPAEVGGSLNPTWVEWLMGWPLGWTDLKPLETAKFQKWLDSHGTS
jgi:hypothetical protein